MGRCPLIKSNSQGHPLANISIPNLPVAVTLDGTEQLEIVQPPGTTSGVSKRATAAQIAGLASTGGATPSSTFILATANAGLVNSRVLAVDTADIVYTDSGALGTALIGPINTAAISYAKFQQVAALLLANPVRLRELLGPLLAQPIRSCGLLRTEPLLGLVKSIYRPPLRLRVRLRHQT